MAYIMDRIGEENLKTTAGVSYRVVHPLFDEPEQKRDVDGLGRIHMTRSVKLSLLALRAYLVVMALLVLYHFAAQAKII
ncbi:MAG TPA: hypothetical protein VI756_28905 [Blastocatellia bacterium]